ncbi:hypothetical protein PVAND_012795 [Polypedilum vanderplanki]|uniref:Uncharacterized protein n=1 Tax=Polypedilum vanderplanki TaxID=319348 RepID=A0A9J6CMQ7_POLVA|nr:hypothetical protein PVAND_012795 [Polypedilum vanderplanki]
MLPTYQRFTNSGSGKIRSFRASERILILLVFISFLIIVLFGFFLLPDFGGTSGLSNAYKNLKIRGPEIFIPAPPIEKSRDTFDLDKIRLEQKINSELNDIDLLEKPEILQPPKVPIAPIPVPDHNHNHHQKKPVTTITNSEQQQVYNVDGADQDETARKRRDKVKEVSTHHHERAKNTREKKEKNLKLFVYIKKLNLNHNNRLRKIFFKHN